MLPAIALGAKEVVDASGRDLGELLLELTDGIGFDVVIEATGAPHAPAGAVKGTRRGGRHVRGGRAAVRRILYLAALSAVRHNPALKSFRDRLSARGKKPKVILTAVARKLLVIANAVIRTGLPWDPALAMAR